jgi:small subunit ribosomal protein S1
LEHPSEVLKVGDEIEVKVITVDRDRRRIGLSRRVMLENPWNQRVKDLKIGQLVEGEISRLTSFGAFAKLNLPGDLEGLIHISELSENRIDHPKEVIKPGDVVTLRILKIEEEDQRIGLSLRRVDSPAYADMDWKTLVESYNLGGTTEGETIGDIVGEEVPAETVEETETTAPDAVVEEAIEEVLEETVEELPSEIPTVEEVIEESEEVEAAEEVEEDTSEPKPEEAE